jgi:nucleotide-binding universal stress UspA family protein
MKPIQTLLVATDFSTAAKRAEERAALLAAEHDARLVLLHSLSGRALQRLRERLTRGYASTEAQLLEHYRDALQRQAEDLATRWRIEVTPRLVAGQAHREISRAAGDLGVALVVVGASGDHPAIDFFLGATAERVVRESPVPVLVVRREAREPYARVLAALDLTPHAPAVVDGARLVAPAASLTLGHAFEVPFEGKLQFAGASQEEIDRYRHEEREHALAKLRALAETRVDQADIRVEHGTPDTVLLHLLRETSADLVVTGKHGGSEIIDLLLGSVTKHLLREFDGDVLVVPPAPEALA